MGPMGWMMAPYSGWPSYWGRCFRFPWLPRWWWTGMYGPAIPYTPYAGATQYYPPGYTGIWPSPFGPASKEEEKAALEEQAKFLEEELSRIKQRLDELGKAE